nr:zf-HC2 domain-containing protein [Petrachloros mirabilis]
MDVLNRDRFELLSAYLDGEVSAPERQQVETWLQTDSEFQALYQQLLTLQQGWQRMPLPAATAVEQTLEQVMARLDRRSRLVSPWLGLGAIAAAAIVGLVSGLIPGSNLWSPQMAQTSSPEEAESPAVLTEVGLMEPSALMVALERPPIDIPLTPVSFPQEDGQP